MSVEADKSAFGKFAISFAALIVIWAFLHDWHLISIEPRHFTEYHRELLPISNPVLLAFQFATVAALGPGLAFGMLAYFAARWGRGVKISLCRMLGEFSLVLALVEVCLQALGWYAFHGYDSGLAPLYPEWAYPEITRGLIYTQTVNISTYVIAPLAGIVYLGSVFCRRRKERGH